MSRITKDDWNDYGSLGINGRTTDDYDELG